MTFMRILQKKLQTINIDVILKLGNWYVRFFQTFLDALNLKLHTFLRFGYVLNKLICYNFQTLLFAVNLTLHVFLGVIWVFI
jgi:hypothetical protein